jgi:MoxR-like ATPase
LRQPGESGIALPGVDTTRLVLAGASPRGVSFAIRAARVAAWLKGRDMVVPEDLREIFFETMAHRVFFEPVYELRRDEIARALIAALFDQVPAP